MLELHCSTYVNEEKQNISESDFRQGDIEMKRNPVVPIKN